MSHPIRKPNGSQWFSRTVIYAVALLSLNGCVNIPEEAIYKNNMDDFLGQLRTMPSSKIPDYMGLAIEENRWDMVDVMIRRGDDFRLGAQSFFHILRPYLDESRVSEIVNNLMKRGFDPNKPFSDGTRALSFLCPYPNVAKALVDHGALVEIRGTRSAVDGCLDSIVSAEKTFRESLPKTADLIRENSTQTAIMYVKKGADTRARLPDENNRTVPLLIAALFNAPLSLSEALIQHGADILDMKDGGYSALHSMAKKGDATSVKFVLDRAKSATQNKKSGNLKSNYLSWLNQQDFNGDTALHYAARAGNEGVIRVLVAEGIDTDLRNKAGNTAQMEFDAKLARDEAARKQQLANEAAADRKRQQDATDRDNTVRGLVAMAGMTAANYQANKNMQAAQSAQAANFYADSKRAAEEQKADVARRNELFRQASTANSSSRNSVAQTTAITSVPAKPSNQFAQLGAASPKQKAAAAENAAATGSGMATKPTWIEPVSNKMLWSDANNYCRSRNGRLPSLNEIRDLYLSGMTKGWVNKGDTWTSDKLGVDSQRYAYDTNGNGFGVGYQDAPGFKDNTFFAACVR